MGNSRQVYVCKCGHITLGCYASARMTRHLWKHLDIKNHEEYSDYLYEKKDGWEIWKTKWEEFITGLRVWFYVAPTSEKDLTDRQRKDIIDLVKNPPKLMKPVIY